jgi:zinc protease
MRYLAFFLYLVCTVARGTLPLVEHKTKAGILFWYMPLANVPVVTMAFAFKGGGVYDPPGKEGLTDFSCGMLLEGTTQKDVRTLTSELEQFAIEMSFTGGIHHIGGVIRMPAEHRFRGFHLLKEVLTQPRLAEDRLALLKEQHQTSLRNYEKTPAYAMDGMLREKMYAGHPYGRDLNGTVETIGSFTKEDLLTLYAVRFRRDTLRVVIVGDISMAEASTLIDEVFGALPEKAVVTPAVPQEVPFSGQVSFKEGPFDQSQVTFHHPGLASTDPHFPKEVLLSDILGGRFTSRLNKAVRIEKGLVYNISTMAEDDPVTPLLTGSFGSRGETVDQAIMLTRDIYQQLKEKGITPDELAIAKKSLINAFSFVLSSSPSAASTLLNYQLRGFSTTYVKERSHRLQAITLGEMQSFIKRFLKPDALTFFVVGRKPAASGDKVVPQTDKALAPVIHSSTTLEKSP